MKEDLSDLFLQNLSFLRTVRVYTHIISPKFENLTKLMIRGLNYEI